MEQKIKSLKTASKVTAVIMKIGYIAMIVAICICASALIFLAVTGGKTSIVLGGTTIGITDASVSSTEVIAMFTQYLVMSGFLFAIFLPAQKMFGEISLTGDPFTEKYGKAIRLIGILIAAMTVTVGITDTIISLFADVKGIETYTEAPGLVFGVVVFCLSYIIDYGCALKRK